MFVDNEWTHIAKREQQFRYEPNAVIEHMHYTKYQEAKDEVSELGLSSYQLDRELWFKRRAEYG